MKRHKNIINGKYSSPHSGKYFPNKNPADTGDVIALYARSDSYDVNLAVKAARKSFEKWKSVPPASRGNIILKAYELLINNKELLAET